MMKSLKNIYKSETNKIFSDDISIPPDEILFEIVFNYKLMSFVDDNGRYHSDLCPAITLANGKQFWFYHGIYVDVQTKKGFDKWKKLQSFL